MKAKQIARHIAFIFVIGLTQQAHAQLVQAVQNSGTAFGSVSGQIDAMSERFAKLGYENDEVEAARSANAPSRSSVMRFTAASPRRTRHWTSSVGPDDAASS